MEPMTSQQAATRALELHNLGLSGSKISKILAREGYVSYKTGKPLTPTGALWLVHGAKNGKVFEEYKRFKHAEAHLKYLPAEKKRELKAAKAAKVAKAIEEWKQSASEALDTAEVLVAPAAKTRNNDLAEEQDARAALTLAAEHLLKALFGVPMRVTLPLDRAFRVKHD